MNKITITADKMSRINKRLHKALQQELQTPNPSINLSQTGELLAKVLGFKNTHHLQQTLQPPKNITSPSLTEHFLIQRIEQLISEHIQKHSDHPFLAWEWRHNTSPTAMFSLDFFWKKPLDKNNHFSEEHARIFMSTIGGRNNRRLFTKSESDMGHPFRDDNQELRWDDDIQDNFNPETFKLIEDICSLLPFDDKKKMVSLNYEIGEYTTCKAGQAYEIFRSPLKAPHFNLMIYYYMDPQYLLLPEGFEEKSVLKTDNSKSYWNIKLEPETPIYPSFEEAKQQLKAHMVIGVFEKAGNRENIRMACDLSHIIQPRVEGLFFRHASWDKSTLLSGFKGGVEEMELFMRMIDEPNWSPSLWQRKMDAYPINSYYFAMFKSIKERLDSFYSGGYLELIQPKDNDISHSKTFRMR